MKNGAPAQRTTGALRASSIHVRSPGGQSRQAMTQHRERQRGDRQRQGPRESPAEVAQFGVVFVLRGRRLGFQCHPADGACARADLPYLGMHGAGVDHAVLLFRAGGWRVLGTEEAGRIGDEAIATARRTEVVVAAADRGMVWRGVGIDRHSADRIDDAAGGRVGGGTPDAAAGVAVGRDLSGECCCGMRMSSIRVVPATSLDLDPVGGSIHEAPRATHGRGPFPAAPTSAKTSVQPNQ